MSEWTGGIVPRPRRAARFWYDATMRVSRVTPFLADLGGGKNLCFVKVETDGGPHGWGEYYTQADRDTSVVALVEAIGRYLVGRDASHITHFVHWAYHDWAAKRGAMDFWSAVSGLEQALWDIAGKRHGAPVHALLGGPCRERVRVYANGWYGAARTPAQFAQAAERPLRDGYRALKCYPLAVPDENGLRPSRLAAGPVGASACWTRRSVRGVRRWAGPGHWRLGPPSG